MSLNRRRILRWTVAVLAVVALTAGAALYYIARQSPMLRDRVVAALNERFDSQVALELLQVSAWPKPGVNGTGLELRHNGRTDVPPLITIKRFSGDAGLTGLFATPLHLGEVTLEEMSIQIPPGGMSSAMASAGNASAGPGTRRAPSLVVDKIHARKVWLEIASRNPQKLPRVFDIHELEMSDFRPDAPATFHARLTNAIPTGEVHTDGSFGPYLAHEPAKTAIAGKYTLDHAQLNDIKGLGGTLASTGTYQGQLERLVVDGETRSQDFAIDVAHQPVSLTTTFRAVVDATNGDTLLEKVHATLINTAIEASGAVVRAREVKGRHVELDVQIPKGNIDDVLRLAVSGKAPLTGGIVLKARLVIPAGEGTVLERMELNGNFSLSQARFANFNVQKRLNVLSKRAQGDEESDGAESVVSNMTGTFVMRNGRINFSTLTFSLPGARVELAGWYAIKAEAMNFQGNLLLDATLADTTSGLKAIAARLVQPFFRRPGGGSKLPIRITGTRNQPSFGLDLKKAFLPG